MWIVSPGCSFPYTTGIRYVNAKYDSAASIVVIVSSQSCTVGSQYEAYTEVSDPRRWYLNSQLPATCSGNVTGYTAYYYPISSNGDYRAYISMWTPTASGYRKVSTVPLREERGPGYG